MKKHITVQYIANRSREWLYRKMNPDVPWLTQEANAFLSSWLKPTMKGVELGSGRSTIWFAKRVQHLISIESDKSWYDRISGQLKSQGLNNVEYHLGPITQNETIASAPYLAPLIAAGDNMFDFLLVDGEYRDYAALVGVEKVKSSGILIVDNVNWFLPSGSISPASLAINQPCLTSTWDKFNTLVKDWKTIWTSNGVSDTAIFIKP